VLQIAFSNGRVSVSNTEEGGAVRAGEPADILLLDWANINDDRLRDDIDSLDLVLTRATARQIRELIVNGRTVVKDGLITGIDFALARAEVLAQMRKGMEGNATLAAAMPALDHAIARYYEPDGVCI
jgi:cytosine/adenosine deaminase-related metal-dependent hydrolase